MHRFISLAYLVPNLPSFTFLNDVENIHIIIFTNATQESVDIMKLLNANIRVTHQ